jgi:hypothetical protein
MKRALRLAAGLAVLALAAAAADKQILMIAGKPSHGPGQHEHNAGVLLLAKWLNGVPGIHATTSLSGAWPESAEFEKADAIFVFADGGDGHPVFQGDRPATISKAVARGAGLMFFHYATEPPETRGHQEMLDWLGGFFEVNRSVNPVYEAAFNALPAHPITRGVKPFHIRDEWYYNIHFRENLRGFTGILITTPPADTVKADGLRSGNPDVRSKIGQPHFVAWAGERQDGGRSVGFTGGHYHANLGDENFRKIVLNALLWIAKAEVPPNGVQVAVTPAGLTENLDPKPPQKKAGN